MVCCEECAASSHEMSSGGRDRGKHPSILPRRFAHTCEHASRQAFWDTPLLHMHHSPLKVESERKGQSDARHATPTTRPTPTAMSSNATHGTDTPSEGDTVTHVERALSEMLLKGADCAKCGAVRSTDGSKLKKCACKLVCYCGKECQRGDWADHKAHYNKARATAQQADAQEALPGLPNHLVVTHILRSEYFDDPADLARLPAVSRAMRDAVAATGLEFEEIDEDEAANIGCLSAVQRLQRGGRLSRQEYLCEAAARGGHLEELQGLRADGCPWDANACWAAALGGHLEVLQWARANYCPWDRLTCSKAAVGGHLGVLQWARANGCPWDENTCGAAAANGHLGVLQWATANGCPCDWRAIKQLATKRNHPDVLAWMNTKMDELGGDGGATCTKRGVARAG